MREAAPKMNTEVIDLQEGPDGEWRMLEEKAPAEAEDMISAILGYEDMKLAERVSTLKDIMEGLSADEETRQRNRFVVEELAKKAKAIELMESIEKNSTELERVGSNVDVRV